MSKPHKWTVLEKSGVFSRHADHSLDREETKTLFEMSVDEAKTDYPKRIEAALSDLR
jgi:hypothetical protein